MKRTVLLYVGLVIAFAGGLVVSSEGVALASDTTCPTGQVCSVPMPTTPPPTTTPTTTPTIPPGPPVTIPTTTPVTTPVPVPTPVVVPPAAPIAGPAPVPSMPHAAPVAMPAPTKPKPAVVHHKGQQLACATSGNSNDWILWLLIALALAGGFEAGAWWNKRNGNAELEDATGATS